MAGDGFRWVVDSRDMSRKSRIAGDFRYRIFPVLRRQVEKGDSSV
jgi:hypothetical protein